MAVNLSPVGGVAAQFFDNNGVILSGGKIYTYAAGTTTNQATYTSAAGVTAHTNPIILDSAGRVPSGEIWLTDGLQYKFVIKNANDVTIGTYDNIIGINSNFLNYEIQEEVQTATAGQTVFTLSTVTYTPNTNTLQVFVDGVNQYDGVSYAYVETDSTTVTFTAGLHVGALVKFTTAVTLSAGVTDASLVVYNPPFTGAVATNVEDKLAQYVSVMDFGAVGDGVTDDSAAIQAAFDASSNVYFPNGTYVFATTIEVTKANPNISGENEFQTLLKYTGATKAFNFDGVAMLAAGGAYVNLENFGLTGNPTSPKYFDVGTYAFYDDSGTSPYEYCNFTGKNIRIERFETLFSGNGGFYWKFVDCQFLYTSSAFYRVTPNNLAFFGCRFGVAKNFVQITAGAGPVSFFGCSMEGFTDYCVSCLDGAVSNVNMHGCYFENDATVNNTGTGLGNFTAGIVIGGDFADVSFIGNNIQCQGIRRIVYISPSGSAPASVVALANFIYYESGSASTTDYLYYIPNAGSRVLVQDKASTVTSLGIGSYTTVGVLTGADVNVDGYDPVSDKPLTNTWINITPANGWINSGGAGFPVLSCKIDNGILYIRGQIDGSSASSTTIGTLPTSISSQLAMTSTYAVFLMVENNSGTMRSVRLLSDFTLAVYGGTYATVFNIPYVGIPTNG